MKRTSLRKFAILAAMSSCLLSGFVPAQSVVSAPDEADMRDGLDFLGQVDSSVHKMNNYECESSLEVHKPDKVHKAQCRFFFKESQIRIECMGGGFRDGSVVVRRKDGSVRGKGGGMMGFIIMNLDPDSRMLILPSGDNALKTDIATVMDEMKDLAAKGYTVKVSKNPLTDKSVDVPKVYIMEIYEPSSSPARLSRRLWIDPDQKAPVRIDFYHDEKLFSIAQFKKLRPNAGLSDNLFQM